MDWETLYCPHRHCRGYGNPFSQGYLVKNGTSHGQPRAWCTACEASVVSSYGTAYYPTPEPTRGVGSPRIWRPVTPAMAAGLTDHIWTTEELLAYRVTVEFLDQLRTIEHLFPAWKVVHHSN
jgi:hypothetical protein